MAGPPRPAGPVTGLILAGGEGRRMGGMKPFARHRGTPLVAHAVARLGPQVDALMVNVGLEGTALALRLAGLSLPVVADDPALAGLGPLSGVQAGLAALPEGGLLATLPCDMPAAPLDLVARLRGARGAAGVVYAAGRRAHPLCALWDRAMLDPLTAALRAARAEGGLRVMRFLAAAGAVAMPVPDAEEPAFANVNDPAGLDAPEGWPKG